MRVISGSVRGLKLNAPEGLSTRPTLDRVKEAVFSMLYPYLCDAVILDAFSGSGALGIESISRGAQFCVFADNNPSAIKCINDNLKNAKMGDRAYVFAGDVFEYIKKQDKKFDIIFIDPPYASGIYKNILEEIYSSDILNEDGLILAEWHISQKPEFGEQFTIAKEKKYGRVGITLFKRG